MIHRNVEFAVSNFALVSLILIGAGSCKQRNNGSLGSPNKSPDIPKVEIQPVDSARVEELQIQFKATLEKVLKDPEAAARAIGISKVGSNARSKAYIVRLRPSAPFMLNGENPDTPLLAAGGVIKQRLELINAVTAEFPDATDENYMVAVGKFLTDNLQVLSVEPDTKVRAIGTPNDPRFSELWGLNNANSPRVDIRATNAWSKSTGSPNVVIGVIDSGIDYNHPDLVNNIWQNPGETGLDAQGRDKRTNKVDDDKNGYVDDFRGWDFVANDNNPMDENNHGTHVAGTIGAQGNNGVGVVGVNWSVKMVPLRFLDKNGEGYSSDAIAALQYATKMGFFATNHSWGGGTYSQAMFDAIKAANASGQLFIAAAGNETQNNDVLAHYPSSYQLPNVIAVAAINKLGELAWFSNYGKTKVHLAAPGAEILSTIIGNGYATYQGTSMATPHVTGLAALLKAANTSLSASEIKAAILNSVTPLTSLSGKTTTGGMINAEAAIGYIKDTSPPNAPVGLSIVSRGVYQAKISWTPATDTNPNGAIQGYEIRYSNDRIASDSAWSSAVVPSKMTYDVTQSLVTATVILPVGFRGFVAVRSRDAEGNLSPLSANLTVNLLQVSRVASYSGESVADFPGTPWVVENDSIRGKVLSDGVGLYPVNAKRQLKLPSIPIRAYDMLMVRFWHRLSVENNYDTGSVFVESNLANSSSTVKSFSKTVGDWELVELDLTPNIVELQNAVGVTTLSIGFMLSSDSSVQADGWYLDDIEVVGVPSLLTVTGIPDNASPETSFSVSLSQTNDVAQIESYKAVFDQSTVRDCSLLTGLEYRSILNPFAGSISEIGKSGICLLAPLKDYDFTVKRYYVWNRVPSAPPVASISGLPTGSSNKKDFSAKISGPNVAWYSYFLTSGDDILCDTASFASWVAVSEPITIAVTQEQKNVLCVKGKNSQGEIQADYTKLAWISDFTAPMAIVTGEGPVSSLKATTELTVSGVDVSGYRYATGTNIDSCVSYTSSLGIDKKIVLSTVENGDGERSLCVKGTDSAGNEQTTPTILTWTQDTVAQPIGFSGLPTAVSSLKKLDVKVLANEAGQYRYAVTAGTSCDKKALMLAASRDITQGINDSLSTADGPYTLCGILIDSAGNVQSNPTSYAWTKDSVAPVAKLSGLPQSKTTSMTISVDVGGDGVASYKYATAIGSANCNGLTYKTSSVTMPINETFTTKGAKKLCVSGIDAAGNIQSTPVVYSWEIVSQPILSASLVRVPPSPNSKQLLNIGVISPSTQNIKTYRYGFAPGIPGNCARMTTWSSYRSISIPITDNLGSYQGYRTLCVVGKDADGFEQLIPTMATWLKIDGAQSSPPTSLFGAVSVISKTASSVTFRITRNVLAGAQNIVTKICPLDVASGSISGNSCKVKTAQFSPSAKTLDVLHDGLSKGNYVVVVLPSVNRIEALNISL